MEQQRQETFKSSIAAQRENSHAPQGKAAVVTGAGRGIGREVALLLAKEGASVIVNDPGVGRGGEATQERPADDVVAEIKAAGGKAQANYDSVADYLKAGAMVSRCVEEFGKIDILVNVAGKLRERMIWNMSEDDFDAVVGGAPERALEHVPSRDQVHAAGGLRPHHQFLLRRLQGLGRPVQLQRGQGRHHRADALDRQGSAHKFGITANAMCPSADTRMTLTEAVKANRKRRFEQRAS